MKTIMENIHLIFVTNIWIIIVLFSQVAAYPIAPKNSNPWPPRARPNACTARCRTSRVSWRICPQSLRTSSTASDLSRRTRVASMSDKWPTRGRHVADTGRHVADTGRHVADTGRHVTEKWPTLVEKWLTCNNGQGMNDTGRQVTDTGRHISSIDT